MSAVDIINDMVPGGLLDGHMASMGREVTAAATCNAGNTTMVTE